jgi:hypothetical protein
MSNKDDGFFTEEMKECLKVLPHVMEMSFNGMDGYNLFSMTTSDRFC